MKFIRDVGITFGARVFTIGIGLISSIVIARVFGPEGKGIFAYIGFITSLVMLIGNLGIANANIYFFKKDVSFLRTISGNSLFLSLGLGVFLVLLGIVGIVAVPNAIVGDIPTFYAFVILPLIPFLLILIFFQNIFLALGRIFTYNFVPFVITAVQVIGIVGLILLYRASLSWIVVYWVAAYILGILYFPLALLKSGGLGFSFDKSIFSKMLRYGIKGYVASLFAFLILKADLYLINTMLGVKELGLYSIASSIGDYIFMISVAVGTILFPKVAELGIDAKIFTVRAMHFVFLAVTGSSLLLFFFAEPLVVFMFGRQFSGSLPAIFWLIPGIIFFSLSILLMNHFAGRGNPPIVIWSPAVAFIINIVLNIVLIPLYGIIGAAAASSAAYTIMFLINAVYFLHMEKVSVRTFLLPHKEDVHYLSMFIRSMRKPHAR